jgi:hypothetical protein
VHSIGKVQREVEMKRRRYLVVPVCFRDSNGATVPHRWAFSPFALFLYFLLSKFCFISVLQELYFWVESVLGLDVSLLRLLEVDNVPDGVEVLPNEISNELNCP